MPEVIGIDLGTSFSVVARINTAGHPEVVYNDDGKNVTPSVVLADDGDPGTWTVGEEARMALGVPDSDAIGRFKRDIGTDRRYTLANGSEVTPEQLSTAVLRKLWTIATQSSDDLGSVVVTIPANFGHAQRVATMEAAKAAGLDVEFITNEPTAAALFFASTQPSEVQGKYAVFDLGGGTFDVSLLEIKGRDAEVIATEGVMRLGGSDFDLALQRIVHESYEQHTGSPCSDDDYTLVNAEEDKRLLSKQTSIKRRVRGDGGAVTLTIDRADFEAGISGHLTQMRMLCENVLQAADLAPADIDGVILAGGSTRVPAVWDLASDVFEREPIAFGNPDEIVALGAAIYAAYRAGSEVLNSAQASRVEGMSVRERTSMCYGTTVLRSSGEEIYNHVMIERGSEIPCTVTETFGTVVDGQRSVKCDVTESGSHEDDPEFVKTIWVGDLTIREGRPAGHPVVVQFSYNANQVMECSFRDGEDGEVQRTSLHLNRGSDAEPRLRIEDFLLE